MLINKILLGAILVCAGWQTYSFLKRRNEFGLWKTVSVLLLKFGWITILMIILFLPLRSRSRVETITPLKIVLDGTQSYRLPGIASRDRYSQSVDMLKGELGEELSRRFDITFYQINADGLEPLESIDRLCPPERAGVTPLTAVLESLADHEPQTPILLFSDGLDTAEGIPPKTVACPEGIGPVYAVEFPYRPRPRILFSSIRYDTKIYRAALWNCDVEIIGWWDSPAQVELLCDGRVIGARFLPLLEDPGEKVMISQVTFSHHFNNLGPGRITLRILPGSNVLTSAPFQAAVDILPPRVRKVWFITFNPGIDTVFWRRSLRSLPSVELVSTAVKNSVEAEDRSWGYQETDSGREYLRLDDMTDLNQFDLIMIHGPGPGYYPPLFWGRVAEYLNSGGAVVHLSACGPTVSCGEGSFYMNQTSPLYEMEEDVDLGDWTFDLLDLLPAEITGRSTGSPEFNPSGFLPIRRYNEDAVQVLLQHPTLKSARGAYPIFARIFSEKGVLANWFALNTWRISLQPGGSEILRKLIHWIMDQTDSRSPSPIKVEPDNHWLATGREYEMKIYPYRDRENLKKLSADIQGPGVKYIRSRVSGYETSIEWVPFKDGHYTMRILDSEKDEVQSERYQSDGTWLEWAYPELDHDLFASVLSATGGGLIDSGSFDIDQINDTRIAHLDTGSFHDNEPVWDRWWLFSLLAASMLGEWAIRRKIGLA